MIFANVDFPPPFGPVMAINLSSILALMFLSIAFSFAFSFYAHNISGKITRQYLFFAKKII